MKYVTAGAGVCMFLAAGFALQPDWLTQGEMWLVGWACVLTSGVIEAIEKQ